MGGGLRPVTAGQLASKTRPLDKPAQGFPIHAVVEGSPAGGAGVETVGLPGTESAIAATATPRSRSDDGGRGGAQGRGGHSVIWKRVRKGFCKGPLSQDKGQVCGRVTGGSSPRRVHPT